MAKMTIYIPDDLKRRMDEAEGVNWSPLACRAFESKLAEITAQKGAKDMRDVVARLRLSKAQGGDEMWIKGLRHGRLWAEKHAEAVELERLDTWTKYDTIPTWSDGLLRPDDPNSPFPRYYHLAGTITGYQNLSDESSTEFWGQAVGGDHDELWDQMQSGQFLIGFVEGALAVWHEVKDQL